MVLSGNRYTDIEAGKIQGLFQATYPTDDEEISHFFQMKFIHQAHQG